MTFSAAANPKAITSPPVSAVALPALPDLPALRVSPAKLTLIVDSREQAPLAFTRLPAMRGTLQTGDYSFAGGTELFTVERKSIADLVASVTKDRERFEREMHRLRGLRFKRLLIVGSRAAIEAGQFHSKASPKAVLHTLDAWEARYDVPVVFADTAEAAAALVESWAYWNAREIILACNALSRASAEANQTETTLTE
jgi:ERCC4-type nuclease